MADNEVGMETAVLERTWLDEAIERWGEPRLRFDEEKRVPSDRGPMYRRCWVWFPIMDGKPVNVHLSIDHYPRKGDAEFWRVECGYHSSPWPDTGRSFQHDPTDNDVRCVIARGWPPSDGE